MCHTLLFLGCWRHTEDEVGFDLQQQCGESWQGKKGQERTTLIRQNTVFSVSQP